MNQTYHLQVTFHTKPGQREMFLRRLVTEGVLDAIRRENGCLRYDFYLSLQDENELLLLEEWECRDHQQVHMTQPHMQTMKAIQAETMDSSSLAEIEVR